LRLATPVVARQEFRRASQGAVVAGVEVRLIWG
jgi:hypothetical protein